MKTPNFHTRPRGNQFLTLTGRRKRLAITLALASLCLFITSGALAGGYGRLFGRASSGPLGPKPPAPEAGKTVRPGAAPTLIPPAPAQAASISTDKTGYRAGETVNISGSGFVPYEGLSLQAKHADGSAEPGQGHEAQSVTAGADGSFTATWTVSAYDAAGNDFVVTAAGASSASASFQRVAEVRTDKFDYAPGETAVISGAGFRPGEVVTLRVEHSTGNNDGEGHQPYQVVADANGDVTLRWYVHPDDSLGSIFRLTAVGADTRLAAASTFTDLILTVIDDQGPDDEPGQKDLNQMSSELGASAVAITWNWDDTDFGALGGNTGDACALVDINLDGKAEYAFCVVADGKPASQVSNRLYTCNNTRSDRCAGPALVPTYASTSTASVVPNTDPFAAYPAHSDGNDCDTDSNCLTDDTVANVTLRLSDVGGASAAKLLNVCSYPSQEPNSDPSDCVVTPDSGFLTIEKVASPNDGTPFTFNLGAGQSSQGGVSSWTINGSGSVQQITFAPGTSYDLSEMVPAGWTLASASCAVQTAVPTPTGTWSGDAVSDITIQSGLETRCVFTDTKNPKLTVTKVVVNDNGGTKQVSDFPLFVDGSPVTSGAQNTFAAGVHTVSETGDPAYAATIGGDCAPDGSITLAPGDIKQCTITNDDVAPRLYVIKHVVNDNGGTASAADFTMSVTGGGPSPASFAGAEAPGTMVTLGAGAYSVGETGPSGYAASYSAGCSGSIAVGETKTCTVTNDDIAPTLKLVKTVVNDNGGNAVVSDFPLFISGSPATSGTAVTLNAGSYTAGETSLPGYAASPWGGDCAADGSVTLAVGQNKTCTITNDDVAPQLRLLKTVVNDDGGNAVVSDFPLFVNGNAVTSGVFNSLSANTLYTASETTKVGYTASVWGGDCNPDGTITLNEGDTKTCTITNNDVAPTLKLVKTVVNDNGGTKAADDWTLSAAAGAPFDGRNFGDAGGSGVFRTVFANAGYDLGETAVPGYTAGSWSCSGGTLVGSTVTLDEGQNVTCTITNDDQAATLIVIKHVVNDNGGTASAANFTLDAGGVNDSPDNFPGAEAPGTAVTLDAGGFNVTETGPSGYSASFSAGCSGTIANGETKTCTVTNDDIRPQLIVIKHVVNDNGGTASAANFTMEVSGNNVSPVNFAGSEAGVNVALDAGSYSVAETGPTGYAPGFSADCTGSIAVGETKTCTVTNNDISPTLTVFKDIVPDGDTGLFNLLIDGIAAAANVGDGGTTGAVAVNAGAHVVGETAGANTTLSDYVTAIGGDCAADGSVTLALGQNKTCTITNTKKGTAKVNKTVSGGAPAGGQSFTFQIREGASPSQVGAILESGAANAANGGVLDFNTKLAPGSTYQICEIVMPGWMTTLGSFVPNSFIPPDGMAVNPNVDNSILCADFSVQPGETKTFAVDNTPPPGGRALTIGFWKNWSGTCSGGRQADVLGQSLAGFAGGGVLIGDLFVDQTCLEAVPILDKREIGTNGKKMASDPAYGLAAQLLAARLNQQSGAYSCGPVAIALQQAQALLDQINFTGTGSYLKKMSPSQAAKANCLAAWLDDYNNNRAAACDSSRSCQ